MSKTRYFSKSRIKIKSDNKYEISLNRKDYEYYKEVLEYADRISRLVEIDHDLTIKFSVDKYTGKIKRKKSIWSSFDMSDYASHYIYK